MPYDEDAKREAAEILEAGHSDLATQRLIEGLPDKDLALEDDEDRAATAKDQADIAAEMLRQREGDNRGSTGDSDGGDPLDDVVETDEGANTDVEGSEDADADAEDGPPRLELDEETLESLVTVKVQGEEIEVPLREALDGQMRHRDYTKKTTELAEKRRKLETIQAEHEELIEAQLAGLSDMLTPGQKQALMSNYQSIQQEKARTQEAALRKKAKAEQAALEEALGWNEKDADAVKAEQAQLRATAEAYGFSPEELEATIDHRGFVMLRDAMRYREIEGKGDEIRKKAKKSPVLKPGSTATRKTGDKRKREEAKKRFRRTGSMRDGAAVLEAFDLVD